MELFGLVRLAQRYNVAHSSETEIVRLKRLHQRNDRNVIVIVEAADATILRDFDPHPLRA
jgi:hypothetical protein